MFLQGGFKYRSSLKWNLYFLFLAENLVAGRRYLFDSFRNGRSGVSRRICKQWDFMPLSASKCRVDRFILRGYLKFPLSPVLDRVSSEIKFILERLKFCLQLDSNMQGKRIFSTLIILPYQVSRIGILFNLQRYFEFQVFSHFFDDFSKISLEIEKKKSCLVGD